MVLTRISDGSVIPQAYKSWLYFSAETIVHFQTKLQKSIPYFRQDNTCIIILNRPIKTSWLLYSPCILFTPIFWKLRSDRYTEEIARNISRFKQIISPPPDYSPFSSPNWHETCNTLKAQYPCGEVLPPSAPLQPPPPPPHPPSGCAHWKT